MPLFWSIPGRSPATVENKLGESMQRVTRGTLGEPIEPRTRALHQGPRSAARLLDPWTEVTHLEQAPEASTRLILEPGQGVGIADRGPS